MKLDSPSRQLAKKIFAALRTIPGTNPLLMWLAFCLVHRRMPSFSRPGFSDLLYRVKTRELHDPLRSFVSDKELVKLFVSAVVGTQHNIDTVLVTDNIRSLAGRTFDVDVVVKATHLSGDVIFLNRGQMLTDKQLGNIDVWLRSTLFKTTGEVNYKYLRKQVIVEKRLHFQNISDYKFFCAAGKILFVQVDQGRFSNHRRVYYDANWEALPFTINAPMGEKEPPPASLERMKDIASKLSAQFSFVRVDLYSEGDEIFVGEITNCHGSAQEVFRPDVAYDRHVGAYILDAGNESSLGAYLSALQKQGKL